MQNKKLGVVFIVQSILIKAILSTLIISSLVYLTMTILGTEKGLGLTVSGGLAIIIGIISLCLYLQDSKKNAFKELAGRKIYSCK